MQLSRLSNFICGNIMSGNCIEWKTILAVPANHWNRLSKSGAGVSVSRPQCP